MTGNLSALIYLSSIPIYFLFVTMILKGNVGHIATLRTRRPSVNSTMGKRTYREKVISMLLMVIYLKTWLIVYIKHPIWQMTIFNNASLESDGYCLAIGLAWVMQSPTVILCQEGASQVI